MKKNLGVIQLFTPPFLQLNAPYPATATLAGFLRPLGFRVEQRDLSIETALAVLEEVGDAALTRRVIAFLQGHADEEMETFAEVGSLPEGSSFAALQDFPPITDPRECAKVRCSLYLDDLAQRIQKRDKDFGFSRYAEKLGEAVRDFGVILKRLKRKGLVEKILEKRVCEILAEVQPDYVGVTCPFPGTLLGAFRIAKICREVCPKAVRVLGGGYVSTELRKMDDPRVREFFDVVMYDEGFLPWARLVLPGKNVPRPIFVKPDYRGLDFSQYLPMAETVNPMHRLWTDSKWIKLQVARGCYWHKCAFCDVSLDYIRDFAMPKATEVVDAMEALARETGECGFHFTDEALPPALADGIAREILRRGFRCRWWGNIRFDAAWTMPIIRRAAASGMIAVTGGLECANDRLLKLMNKGITCAGARATLRRFSKAGVLTHAYLMYAFPTERVSEVWEALRYVRDLFREGVLHSAFFHRFALTVHSPVARNPEHFGIIPETPDCVEGRTFALNEIAYREKRRVNWTRVGAALTLALYNYHLGLGLDKAPRFWFEAVKGSSSS